ncbi:hypothetical protein D6D18_05149 [Aureobasidium pullulans]|nr:hypothetical protein D6D18_05149 [Aureobasidium pullulans]
MFIKTASAACLAATLPFAFGLDVPPRNNSAQHIALGKAKVFLSQLDTAEKIGLVTGSYGPGPVLPCVGTIAGIPRLNFSGLCYSDGPTGYARSDGVSVFPSGVTVAATWDRDLMYQRALAIGEEFRAKGAHVHLGPSPGPLGRSIVAGRNWEGFGPDPYLAGVATNASVTGIQAAGVQASSKHYIGNEQETQRGSSTLSGGLTVSNGTVIDAVSANIDDRTLHELYLWPFANAVHAGTASVMCGYNRVNGNYTCANPDILNRILKDELAFPGYVLSDWDATHSTELSANGGLDMEMPGTQSVSGVSYFGDSLLAAVNNGTVSMDRLDDMVTRVIMPYYLLGQNQDFPEPDPASGGVFLNYQYGYNSPLSSVYPAVDARDVRADHAKIIRRIGAAGTVLLKNTNGALPLTHETNIGLLGNDVSYPTIGSVYLDYDNAEGYEVGTLDIGGGSGTVRHTSFSTPEEAIERKARKLGIRVQKLFDNKEVAEGLFRTIYPRPQACLVFLKAFATEGTDRASPDLQWNATAVVESTAAFCPNTIVVTHGPGVVAMPWADNPNVTAILAAHYPGEESGNALVDVFWGAVEPSGRLPYSIPRNSSDYGPPILSSVANATDPNAWQVDFTEGQMIDYRQFDANGTEALYEFGFGLSYSNFTMSSDTSFELIDGRLSALPDQSQGMVPGGLADLWKVVAVLKVEVTNSGHRASSAVPQLYVSLPQDTTPPGTPHKVLRGFEKLHLKAGERREARFELMRRDLSYWDVETRQWVVPEGIVQFSAGFSSRNLVARTHARLVYDQN